MTKTILLVDGADSVLLLLHFMLMRLGYEVKTAHTGKEALSLLSETNPDMIITEMCLADMQGDDLCRAVKAHPSTSFIQVVFVSKDGSPEARERGLGSGACDFLTKPIQLRPLYMALENNLEKRRRKMIRIAASLTLHLKGVERGIPLQTTTLGEGGMFIKTEDPYPVGTILGMDLFLDGEEKPLLLEAEVLYSSDPVSTPSNPGMGVRFNNLGPETKSILYSYLERALTPPSPPAAE